MAGERGVVLREKWMEEGKQVKLRLKEKKYSRSSTTLEGPTSSFLGGAPWDRSYYLLERRKHTDLHAHTVQ